MNTITQICDHCKDKFEQPLKEFNRKRKNNMSKNFCSRSCSTAARNESMDESYWKQRYKNQKKTFDIKSKSGNRQDEYSPFRFALGSVRASIIKHKHKHETDIDVKYLKELWEKQNGICPYTGLKMILSRNTLEHSKLKSLKKASLDRIDSSKGYIKGNVEFVCMAINLAKINHTKQNMIQFIQDTLSINQVQPT
jgi:hypothetical protein